MTNEDLKVCSICGDLKDILTEFNKNKCKKDGLQSHCRDCSKRRSKKYYSENREHHKAVTVARKKLHRKAMLQYFYNYVKERGCCDCGENDPCCIDFDHLRDKKMIISKMIAVGFALNSILLEVDKCAIRCANCHRKKTAKEQGWYKSINTGP